MADVLADCDLGAMFGIDLDPGQEPVVSVAGIVCDKCHGRGNFISHAGRIVGKCFACDGSGFARSAAKPLTDGDCVKCAGSGEWRPGRPCFACNGTRKEITGESIDVGAIARAFKAARDNGIKAPKLRLADFLFSRAPDTGRNAGSIYVKSRESGEYLGKVSDGKFRPSMACDAPTAASVIEVAAKPNEAAKAYGLRTGECSCCGRELTNGLSIELGIGPICRDKFGW